MADETKKKRRRRGIGGWAVALCVLGALSVTSLVLSMAIPASLAGRGTTLQEQAVAAPPAWIATLRDRVRGFGFSWLDLGHSDGVAIVSGEAPDQRAADRGFNAAENAIRADSEANADTRVIVNAITVDGAAGVGQALAGLGSAPTASECQNAFAATLDGRLVQFDLGSARITRDSASLLNALTGVAIRCRAHVIEIGGHTDLSGTAAANLLLSEERAQAVQAYLVERGAQADRLSAIGYGMERPLVEGRSREADALNRRIEFTVTDY